MSKPSLNMSYGLVILLQCFLASAVMIGGARSAELLASNHAQDSGPLITVTEAAEWLDAHRDAITTDHRDILIALFQSFADEHEQLREDHELEIASAKLHAVRAELSVRWQLGRLSREASLLADVRSLLDSDHALSAWDRFWFKQRRIQYFAQVVLTRPARIAIDVPGLAELVTGSDSDTVQARLREYEERIDAMLAQAVVDQATLNVQLAGARESNSKETIDELRKQLDASMLQIIDTHRTLTAAIAAAFEPPHAEEFTRLVAFEAVPGLKDPTPCDLAFERLTDWVARKHEVIRPVLDDLRRGYQTRRSTIDHELTRLSLGGETNSTRQHRIAELWKERYDLESATTRSLRSTLASITEPIPADVRLLLSWIDTEYR